MSFFNDVTPQSVANAPDGFVEFKVGDNVAFIKTVEEKFSQNGNPMLDIVFGNDEGAEIHHYIVEGDYKLQKLKSLCVAFSIPMGDTNTRSWIGKRGVVVVKAGEPYNGKVYPKVSYLRPIQPGNGAQPKPQPQPQQNAPASPRQAPAPAAQAPADDGFYDDIPF
jgi:hypothetical protein